MFDELSEGSKKEKNIIVSEIEELTTCTIEELKKQDAEQTNAVLRCLGSTMDAAADVRRLAKV